MLASTQTNHPLAGARSGNRAPSPVELATAKLQSAGLRITQPRIAILAALNKCSAPTSIEQLHTELGSGTCDLVTVYRCMAAFEEIGLVRRAFFHNGTAVYEINLGQPTRYHVVCKATDRVEELDTETSAELSRTLTEVEGKLRARGFAELGHIVEFFGVSPRAGLTAAHASPSTPAAR